ncbi:hypothetical protein [Pseudomonas simiae]|uniref:hypothetical protein n=1 Tax=Pseudomonas simiae TaxID=321846 RepID=UPI0011B1EF28|nr:hypothetical protein [Pseudomonas simiae]
MRDDKLTSIAFVSLLALFIIYAVLRKMIGLDFVTSLLVLLPIFSAAGFIYLKYQWREFFKVSEKLLVGLEARASALRSFLKRGEK